MSNFGGRVGLMENQPADRLLEAADLVITIGYDPVEYEPQLWNNGVDRPRHPHRRRAGRSRRLLPAGGGADRRHRADAPGADAARPGAGRSRRSSKGILQAITADRRLLAAEAAKAGGTPIHPLRIVHELQDVLTEDVTVCLDMGSVHIWLARHLYSFRARQILISDGQQTLGVAMPWAIAACLARPGEKVVSISGDGGFLFSAMELETAVRLKCNFVHLVWVDGTYDMVGIQEFKKYGRKSGVDFGPVDYVKYAEAFGATGFRIRSPEEIAPTLKKAFDTPGPVLIGIPVDYSFNPKLYEHVDERALI